MREVNEADLSAVIRRLQRLEVPYALIGGYALPFLTDVNYVHRPTTDIDIIVGITSRIDSSKLDEQLRELGFRNDMRPGAPRCRWLLGKIIVDILPASVDVDEMGSRWFEEALKRPEKRQTLDGLEFFVISPVYLLATKLDAFFSRGTEDYYQSKDLEDIITLMEACPSLLNELNEANIELQRYVGGRMRLILNSEGLLDSLSGHISAEAPKGMLEIIRQKLSQIAEL